ncbi:hypothetical protein DEU56DRAFT_784752 [Suillus clintonianus]|uniref:uncharacterized protein n=1 Tax=Suillus clintonianus TaxID=1904413 RepID=UPI001B8716E7|nr:uncharacterized protein DEU56DRAFT_784752 [Suillus clintonianus]KAG2147582.1 hypothetical protein DEU56DRAFT_784752 [Suillus clintonianus]
MAPPQDCYSRSCIFISEHSNVCSSCWITCKQTHYKTREMPGGPPSYVCHTRSPVLYIAAATWRGQDLPQNYIGHMAFLNTYLWHSLRNITQRCF